ncbi:hypothetical protein V8F06_003720 [Rhypophila decipiens]
MEQQDWEVLMLRWARTRRKATRGPKARATAAVCGVVVVGVADAGVVVVAGGAAAVVDDDIDVVDVENYGQIETAAAAAAAVAGDTADDDEEEEADDEGGSGAVCGVTVRVVSAAMVMETEGHHSDSDDGC